MAGRNSPTGRRKRRSTRSGCPSLRVRTLSTPVATALNRGQGAGNKARSIRPRQRRGRGRTAPEHGGQRRRGTPGRPRGGGRRRGPGTRQPTTRKDGGEGTGLA